MLKNIIPQYQLTRCENALVAYLGSHGECRPTKFDAYVEVWLDRDVLQRVGAVDIANASQGDKKSKQEINAFKWIDGEIMPPRVLKQFYERGIHCVADGIRAKSKFIKLENGNYCLSATSQPTLAVAATPSVEGGAA